MKEIGVKRLRRDYSKEPLHNGEKPSIEEFKYLLLELNLSKQEIANYFKKKSATTISQWQKFYNVYKTQKQILNKRKETNLNKYGVGCSFQSDVVKAKICKTNFKKYGTNWYTQSDNFKQKYKNTNLKKYGVDNFRKSPKYSEQYSKTCLKKYGVEHYSQTDMFKKQSKETSLEKYGVDNYTKTEEYKRRTKEINNKRYGVDYFSQQHLSERTKEIVCNKEKLKEFINNRSDKTIWGASKELGMSDVRLGQYIHLYGLENLINFHSSAYETEIQNMYPMIVFERTRKVVSPQEIDLYNEERKLGIEFNGNYWHSDVYKDKGYHQRKSLIAEGKGVFIYNVFEYEWDDEHKKKIIISQLDNLLGRNSNKIYARKCKIVDLKPKEKNAFINANHLQPNDNSKIALGLEYEGDLVSVMTFATNWVYGAEWELRRFCSKVGTNVVGGASKLFSHFVKQYNPKSIISYSDIAKTKGNMYKTLGFVQNGIVAPDYIYVKGKQYILKRSCRKNILNKHGIDIKNKTERQIMSESGFSKIYNCGMKRWMWKSQGENNGGK